MGKIILKYFLQFILLHIFSVHAVENCDAVVKRELSDASAVFTGKVELLNRTESSVRLAVIKVKRVFKIRNSKTWENKIIENNVDIFLVAGSRVNVLIPPQFDGNSSDDFLMCFGLFSSLFTLKARDTKMFFVEITRKSDAELKHVGNRDMIEPTFKLKFSPLALTLETLDRVADAVKGKTLKYNL